MIPERLASEWRVGQLGISDEALGGVGVKPKQEWDEKMVSVPKCFVRLLSDFDVGGSEHHEHAEQHNMPCYATSLRVVYLHCALGSYLVPFNIEEATHVSEVSRKWLLDAHLT